jgi:hypothetical protein
LVPQFRSPQSETSAAERDHLWKKLALLKKTHSVSFLAIRRKEEQLRQSATWISAYMAAQAAKAAAHFAVLPSMTTAVMAAKAAVKFCSPIANRAVAAADRLTAKVAARICL